MLTQQTTEFNAVDADLSDFFKLLRSHVYLDRSAVLKIFLLNVKMLSLMKVTVIHLFKKTSK